MKTIEKATRKIVDPKLAVFFMLILIMGAAIMIISPEKSRFNESCIKCYFCIEKCPAQAISLDSHGYPIINKTRCLAWDNESQEFNWDKCGLCLRGCPTKVIDLLNTDPEERIKKTVD